MAEYHLEVRIISRKGGSAATASEHRSGDEVARFDACSAAGYRNGETITNEQTGQTFYQKPEDLARIVSSHVLMPHDLEWDSSRLWNEIDRVEKRHDSVLAKDINILLPHEWTLAERESYALAFAERQFTDKGVPCEVSFHRFGKGYGPKTKAWKEREASLKGVPFYEVAQIPKNPSGMYVAVFRHKNGAVKEFRVRYEHVHIMHATRTISADGTWSNKLRAPAGGPHNLKWEKQQLLALRQAWADHANEQLPQDRQISALTLEAQGIDRVPQPSMGPFTALHRQGIESDRVIDAYERFADVRRLNEQLRERGQLKALEAAAVASLSAERDRRDNMSASEQYPNKYEQMNKEQEAAKAAAQEAERAQTYQDRAKELYLTAEQMSQTEQRLQAFKINLNIEAEKAKRELEEEKKRDDREAREGSIENADRRYAVALGNNYDVRDPYGSLAKAAMAEYAAFNKRQQELAGKAANESDPSKRKELQLAMKIEGCDYMRITSERLATMKTAMTDRRTPEQKDKTSSEYVKTPSELEKEVAATWKERGLALREQRHLLVEARGKEERHDQAQSLGDLARDVASGKINEPGYGGNGRGGKPPGNKRSSDEQGDDGKERTDRQVAGDASRSGTVRPDRYLQGLQAEAEAPKPARTPGRGRGY